MAVEHHYRSDSEKGALGKGCRTLVIIIGLVVLLIMIFSIWNLLQSPPHLT